ncbi:MAG: type III pantothenate kinase [Gammaproteobacteria bacterium]|nr:type III pantothenate kinase [Gammaproteobacteria bacterium]
MAILDIDMGNTRTKWRCGDEAGALPAPELPRLVAGPERVRVASVLGNRDGIAAEIRRRFGVEAEFAATSASLAGVRCGYREPSRLGVDRWLAVVAAWQRTHHALAVISVGTAACADFVDADGRHAGGYIAPGLRLLADTLDRRTADVRPDPRRAPRLEPGTDTQQAVAAGTFLMLSAFVDAAIARLHTRSTVPVAVFLTGGDAALLAPRLGAEVRCEPELVLDGLAIAVP